MINETVTIATCSLNQWALDFTGNYERIRESIIQAKLRNATIRVGSELEIPGYSCQDHYYEADTVTHSWEMVAKLLADKDLYGILIFTGMPVIFKSRRYNCTLALYNGQIVLIRPKMWLASDGNYREYRWFITWTQVKRVVDFTLPEIIRSVNGQEKTKLGDALIATQDCCIGIEMCEELFVPQSAHIGMSLDGAEIIVNGSGSHHELRKLDRRISLVKEATMKCGGVYVYSNQKGCDGDRLYFDGSSMIICNGETLAIGKQFSLEDVEVTVATADLSEVLAYRASIPSLGQQASQSDSYPRVKVDFITKAKRPVSSTLSNVRIYSAQEEINLGPACWLWDYLRRSRMGGFFLPLSGGIDSCSVAMIAYSMCFLVCQACQNNDKTVISEVREILGLPQTSTYIPLDPKELCNKLVHTCYMGTENSSKDTRDRALALSNEIGSYHVSLNFDAVVASIIAVFTILTSKQPRFTSQGGSTVENLALQNIQARLRMVLAYFFAALLLWVRNRPKSLLVLGSSNADESLRGYFTKYDCSSADVNPIGSISKLDLRGFVSFARDYYKMPILTSFLDATPSAELVPITNTIQSDEVEMGMTYEELSVYGRLRKISKCGPYSMFTQLCNLWGGDGMAVDSPNPSTTEVKANGGPKYPPRQIANKVKLFFYYYAVNRHKMTTLTPSYHAESYSPDDNRFDLRPFLINPNWTWQFKKIDEEVIRYEQALI